MNFQVIAHSKDIYKFTGCGVFGAKAMPISNINDPGKVPYYVTGPANINQILVLDGAYNQNYRRCVH